MFLSVQYIASKKKTQIQILNVVVTAINQVAPYSLKKTRNSFQMDLDVKVVWKKNKL
jgi:hypothetical protein